MTDSFRDLLLIFRARTGLTQRDLAARVDASRRTIQDWEAGISHPSAGRLQALIQVLLEAGGLTAGSERSEAQVLWTAVLRETPRVHLPFDPTWLDRLLAEHAAPRHAPTLSLNAPPTELGASPTAISSGERGQDWGEAPDVRGFVGRTDELALLRGWLLDEPGTPRARLVALLGMGGIGKTSLAAKLAQMVAPGFERLYWRSLRGAPPPGEWLGGAIGFVSDWQTVPPPSDAERITVLLQLLRARRCLLVLDNFETLFEPGQQEERYRVGLDGYGRLLQALGGVSHQSCLVVTSREAPAELAVLSGDAVRTFRLGGLEVDEARVLLASKQLVGTNEQWAELTGRFGGNGLALKLVGERIHDLFGGEIGLYLEESGASTLFGDIGQLLAEQIERCSATGQQLLRILAVAREPVRLAHLLATLDTRLGRGAVLNALESLRRRSLVECTEPAAFTLQSVVLEFVTDRLMEEVAEEIAGGQPRRVVEQPLILALAKDYVRQSQERLIGRPILQQLGRMLGDSGIEPRLLKVLEVWRNRPALEQGYGPGNVVNLLRLLRGDLRGLDLSCLAIRQAYLAVDAQNAILVDAQLAETVLAEAFHSPGTVALSGDGALLGAGTTTGQVLLWRVADRTPLWAVQGHASAVWSVALSSDGRLLASGGTDGKVRLWDASSGRLLVTLEEHSGAVWSVALSRDGRLLASSGSDGTVRLWETSTGRPVSTLEGHRGTVWRVALSGDGRLAASGGEDGTVRLWEPSTGRSVAIFEGHSGAIWGVALSGDGRLAASGGEDGTVRLWDTSTGQPLATLEGHRGTVWRVALSGDGRLAASGGEDGTVRLWDTSTGQPLATLQGHSGALSGAALSSDGRLAASGSGDGTVRLWETRSGRPLATLEGHRGALSGAALSADGRLLASGGEDGMVQLWEASSGQPVASFEAHRGTVRGVALSGDGRLLASGGADGTVQLWETSSKRRLASFEDASGTVRAVALSSDGRLLASGGSDEQVRLWETSSGLSLVTLEGHSGTVRALALSADGRLLASGSTDGTVRLWETGTGWPVAALEGHSGAVRGVALSSDGRLLASGGADGTVRLWESSSGRSVATLEGHRGTVWRVALSADGRLLASGDEDGTVRLWETGTGRLVATLKGHSGAVSGVALSADGQLVASGSTDGTMRLWETSSGTALCTLRAERRYQRLDITGLKGITDAQRAALLGLGAVERSA